jgi:integrase
MSEVVLLDEVRRIRELVDPAARIRPILVEHAIDQFHREHILPNPRASKTSEYTLSRLKAHFRGRYLHQVTTADVQAYLRARLEAGNRRRPGRALSRVTTNRDRAQLSKMFSWGIERGFAVDNPVRGVKKFRESPGRTRYLTPEEVDRLLAECGRGFRTPWLKVFVFAALSTGARRGELLSLRWADVLFDVGVVRFRAETTKSGRGREVPLIPDLARLLAQWRDVQARMEASEYVFSSEGKRRSIRGAFDGAVRRAGIRDFHLHDLRHCFASYFMMNGGDLYRLQTYLGHSTNLLTQRYAHLSADYLRQGVGFIGVPGRVTPAPPPAPVQTAAPPAPPPPSLLPPTPAEEVTEQQKDLLRDLWALLWSEGRHLPTTDVLEKLSRQERWAWLQGDKVKCSQKLAAMLLPFGIRPAQIDQRGRNTKGYRLQDLAPAISKYVS